MSVPLFDTWSVHGVLTAGVRDIANFMLNAAKAPAT
jgi:hypothetical protein